jgi:hypothetical protein
MRRCHSGDRRALTKGKEMAVHLTLTKANVSFEYQRHIPFRACGLGSETACAYVDFAIPKPWGYVLLEVDEDQHRAYDPCCDVRRDYDIAASVALGSGHKLVVLRYNPDTCKIDGKACRIGQSYRRATLLKVLADLDAEPESNFSRLFMFYDRESGGAVLPSVALRWDSREAVKNSVAIC